MTKYEVLVKFTGKNKHGIWENENSDILRPRGLKDLKYAIKFCKDNGVEIDSISKLMTNGCYQDVTKRYVK